MMKLYNWTAKRSGASITLNFEAGSITGVVAIAPERLPSGRGTRVAIVATTAAGSRFELCAEMPS